MRSDIEGRKLRAAVAAEELARAAARQDLALHNAALAEVDAALGPFLPTVGWRIPGETKNGLAPSYGQLPDVPKECHMNFVDWLRGPAPEAYEKAKATMLAWLAADHQRREAEHRADKVRTRVETVQAPRPKRLRDFPPVVEPNTQSVAHLPGPKVQPVALFDEPKVSPARLSEPAHEVEPLRWDSGRRRFEGGSLAERISAAQRLRREMIDR